MDGFANPDKECVIVLPAPTRNGYPFAGIKASVLILDESTDKPMQINTKLEKSIEVKTTPKHVGVNSPSYHTTNSYF